MTATDLPTDRLRQLRDGHDPDDANTGRARANRIARLQAQIIVTDELAVEIARYRQAARTLDVRPDVRDLVDYQVRLMWVRTVGERDRLKIELRALQ